MKEIKTVLATIIGAVAMIALTSTTCSNNDVNLAGGNYTFTLNTANINNWSPPVEFYTGFWVFTDGSYSRIQYPSQPPANSSTTVLLPAITIPVPTGSGIAPLAFSTVSNRKGDDTDKKKVSGGYNNSNNNPSNGNLKYDAFPNGQNYMTANEFVKISTDHGTNYALKDNELMLVITINNETNFMTLDSNDQSRYKLHLYHNNNAVTYTPLPGVASGNYPCGDNKYFAFSQTAAGSPTYGSIPALASWNIDNNFNGHEKNVYCVVQVPLLSGLTNVTDQFTALMTNNNGGIMNQTITNYPIIISNSLDPNFIEVDKPTSNTCGAGEEFEYVVHFENTGAGDESIIKINLQLDNAIDKNSVVVTEAGVGNTFNISATQHSITMVNDCQFNQNMPGADFQYSINANPSAAPYNGTVAGDATFQFSLVNLKGTGTATSDVERQGYVKFKVKTVTSFRSIHNQAGIYFCGNSNSINNNPVEIVTNLAETICMKDSMSCDSCKIHLKECRDKLKDFKAGSNNSFMHWLGWIIAGMELLIIIYLLTRKMK